MLDLNQILSPWTKPLKVIPVIPGTRYSTLAGAIREANKSKVGGGNGSVILLPPGDYSADSIPTLDLSVNRIISIIAIGGLGSVLLPAIVATGTAGNLLIESCYASFGITCSGVLVLNRCPVSSLAGAATLQATFSSFSGTVACDSIGAVNTTFGGLITAVSGAVQLSQCSLVAGAGALITTGGTLVSLIGTAITAGIISIVFSGAAGSLEVDSISNHYWDAATETLTNGSLALIGKFT